MPTREFNPVIFALGKYCDALFLAAYAIVTDEE
jgi:hypothetical protein